MKTAPKPISIAEARAIVKANVAPGRTETVPVDQACGRVIAADLFSDIDVTPFDDSAMDGYAVIAADLAAASPESPVVLSCVDHIGAGSYYEGTLESGQTVRIMTGAPIPDGADAVVKYEDVTYPGDGGTGDAISFTAPAKAGGNIRKAAEEAHAGDKVIDAGELISPAGVGLLAACGNLEVEVYARPTVGIISIGSELVEADEMPGRGMIRNSNSWAMRANVAAAGGVPKVYDTVPDDPQAIRDIYAKAVAECDLVLSTGGACLGDFDLTADAVGPLGEILFERVKVKPGKSQPFALIDGKPVFILSGNPAASSMGFELYVRPAMRIMQGYAELDRPTVTARLAGPVSKRTSRVDLERGTLRQAADGSLEVEVFRKQSSGLFGALQKCNCLAVIPEGPQELDAGTEVVCIVTSADEALPLKAWKY